MDLQTIKLKAIEYLVGIQNEKAFKKLNLSLLKSRKNRKYNVR